MRFDVTGRNPIKLRRQERWGRGIFASLLIVVVLVALVYHRLVFQEWDAPVGGYDFGTLPLTLPMAICLFTMYFMIGPGVDFVTVDDSGILIELSNGRSRHIRWDSPRFSLDIIRSTPSAHGVSLSDQPVIYALTLYPTRTFLTEGVVDVIIQMASARGMSVRTGAAAKAGWLKVSLTRLPDSASAATSGRLRDS